MHKCAHLLREDVLVRDDPTGPSPRAKYGIHLCRKIMILYAVLNIQ